MNQDQIILQFGGQKLELSAHEIAGNWPFQFDDQWNLWSLLNRWFDQSSNLTFQSSGTTGEIKSIALNKSFIKASAQRTIAQLGLAPGDRSLLGLSCDRIGGAMVVIRAILSGGHVVLNKLGSTPFSEQVEHVSLVPYQLIHVLNVPDQLAKLNLCRTMLIGGAGLAPNTDLSNVNGPIIYHTYGATEMASHVALKQLHPVPEPYFKLLPGWQMNSNAKGQMSFYTEQTGWIQTNDVGEVYSDNTFCVKGRSDNMINSGGVKIFPESLEQEIEKGPACPWFIGPSHHPTLGQQVTLFLEGQLSKERQERILDLIRNQISERYSKPKLVVCLPEFDTTENGKLKRTATLLKARESGII